MIRAKYTLLVLCSMLAATGCRMCAGPYDCYGPTWLGHPDEPTWEFERAGSAFSGGYHSAGLGDSIIEGEYEMVPAESQPSEAVPSAPMPPSPNGYYPEGMTSAPNHQAPRQTSESSRSLLRPR